ncbi:MAG: dTDP-4-dehydrorhamnose reductase [Candidatus Omnitrophota bacterium]
MNIAITGSSGMLGVPLGAVLSKDPAYTVSGIDLKKPSGKRGLANYFKCDITDYHQLDKAIKDIKPDLIIHTAAYTDVDGCEQNPGKAQTVNSIGTQYVARAAHESSCGLIYISTDFVFDGSKRTPYTEDDQPNPINAYGKSKLEAEKYVMELVSSKKFFIIRTSWLFGPNGKNFVDTILNKARQEKSLKVVSDQFGSPTYTWDLAEAIKNIVDLYGKRDDIYGIYHITNSDDCSWYRLAQKAIQLDNIYDVELIPIVSYELDCPAERPAMSILANDKYIKLFGAPLRRWGLALDEHIRLKGRQDV